MEFPAGWQGRRWLAAIFLFGLASARAAQPVYDVVLVGGRLVDGTGMPWQRADVAIQGDRIAAIGQLGRAPARLRLNVQGLIVAPGFIDIHTHALPGLIAAPAAENYIRQGVTTLLDGQDGWSPLPLGRALDDLARQRFAVNIGFFVGHGSIREAVIGLANRPAAAGELDRMRALVRQAMLEGAFGLSTGLLYVPGCYASTEEIIELARVAGQLGGIYISHVRDEAAGLLESVRETIRIGEEAGLPVQITHHKLIGPQAWGKTRQVYELISEARARGVDITLDQYPYTASSTGLSVLLPRWALAGGEEAFRTRLADPGQRQRILQETLERLQNDRGAGDLRRVRLASCPAEPGLAGKTLEEALVGRGRRPDAMAAAELVAELQQKGGCTAIYHAMEESDVEAIMRWPFTMIASDGTVPAAPEGLTHPRSYGTFARVLGRYVREKRLLRLEEAIHKMTALPAARLRLWDRGILRPGAFADVVVFDEQQIVDRATFDQPRQYAAGVRHVFVNGQAVLLDGKMTGVLPGRLLRGPAWQGTLAGSATTRGRPK